MAHHPELVQSRNRLEQYYPGTREPKCDAPGENPVADNWERKALALFEAAKQVLPKIADLYGHIALHDARLASLEASTSSQAMLSALCEEGLDLTRPIPIVITFNGDDFIASFLDANLSASGDTSEEAFSNLRDVISTTFRIYDELPAAKLGKRPSRQLAILKQFVKHIG